jgi:chromosome segregation ATPase
MFLAELAYNTVEMKIGELENRKEKRREALETSTKELEQDHIDLIQFINDDTRHKNEREEEEKNQQKRKAEREDKLKKIESNIHGVKTEIDKNKDALQGLEKARDFILQIVKDVTPTWYEER